MYCFVLNVLKASPDALSYPSVAEEITHIDTSERISTLVRTDHDTGNSHHPTLFISQQFSSLTGDTGVFQENRLRREIVAEVTHIIYK